MEKRKKNISKDFQYFAWNNTKAFALVLLSLLFYFTYLLASDFIHNTGLPTVDISNLQPYGLGCLSETDGIELPVMTLAMPIFLFCAYLISISKYFNIKPLQKSWITCFYFLIPLSLFALHLRRTEPLCGMSFVWFIIASSFSYVLYYLSTIKMSKWALWLVQISFFIAIIVYGFFINRDESIFDSSFLIGPANKIIQGNWLGTFYMQYDLLSTMVFVFMLKAQLLLHEIRFVLIIIFAVWVLLYKKLAFMVFQNKIVVIYFLVALLLIRGLAIMGGPIAVPQVSPIRLDLWVPLLIVLLTFGFESLVTAVIFAFAYLLNDVFGFFYLGLYLFSLSILAIDSYRLSKYTSLPLKLVKYILPALIALIIHYAIFGSIMSSAGKFVAKLNYSFLPIAVNSSFWLLVWMLPVCLYILVQNKKDKALSLFLYGLVCIQLIYFFGRSHDNNLRNISGILLFILFFAIDKLYTFTNNKKRAVIYISILIGAMVLNYNQKVRDLSHSISDQIAQGLFRPYYLDKQITKDGEFLKSLHTNKILFISDYDSYLYYRLGYSQIGFYNYPVNLQIDSTVSFLYKKVKQGYRLITYPYFYVSIPLCLKPYNVELAKTRKNEMFILDSLNKNMMELKVVQRQ